MARSRVVPLVAQLNQSVLTFEQCRREIRLRHTTGRRQLMCTCMCILPDIARQAARCLKHVTGARVLLACNLIGILLNVFLLRSWTAHLQTEQMTHAAHAVPSTSSITRNQPFTRRHCDIVVGISTVRSPSPCCLNSFTNELVSVASDVSVFCITDRASGEYSIH